MLRPYLTGLLDGSMSAFLWRRPRDMKTYVPFKIKGSGHFSNQDYNRLLVFFLVATSGDTAVMKTKVNQDTISSSLPKGQDKSFFTTSVYPLLSAHFRQILTRGHLIACVIHACDDYLHNKDRTTGLMDAAAISQRWMAIHTSQQKPDPLQCTLV